MTQDEASVLTSGSGSWSLKGAEEEVQLSLFLQLKPPVEAAGRRMLNSTRVFTLTAYFDPGALKLCCFLLTMSLYVVIVAVNVLLILVRQKAVSTCSPHLASLLNFSVGACFEIIQSRFNMSNVPNVLRIFLSLYFLTSPPLFNPVMYGLKLSKIRLACQSLFSRVRDAGATQFT
ncbi:uncharacterized protein V6R79_019528 [Siganus canaliculatus]